MPKWDPSGQMGPIDLAQRHSCNSAHDQVMNSPTDMPPEKPKPSRSEEARRIVEEYLEDLPAILRKLRRHLN